ncbi:MAG: hypothetical protein WCP97_09295 [bacterium]
MNDSNKAYDLPENSAGQSHARWSIPAEVVMPAELAGIEFLRCHQHRENAENADGRLLFSPDA